MHRRKFVIAILAITVNIPIWFLFRQLPSRSWPFLQYSNRERIPNIVHYIWLLERHSDIDAFGLHLTHFLSIYSTVLYIKPSKIYLHTNASPAQVSFAQRSRPFLDDLPSWTRMILALPIVHINHITVPNLTATGRPLTSLEHRSDFLRADILLEYGGVYTDFDILPLRSITTLRESGFANVLGYEITEKLNNGFMMASKGSRLMTVYRDEMHQAYDGSWLSHSTGLLTTVGERLVAIPGEALLLPRKAFAPTTDLWRVHAETLGEPTSLDNEDWQFDNASEGLQDVNRWWHLRKMWSGEQHWQADYASSYVVHAFDNDITDEQKRGVTLEYCSKRQSNYARLVWPVIKHGIENGLIDLLGPSTV